MTTVKINKNDWSYKATSHLLLEGILQDKSDRHAHGGKSSHVQVSQIVSLFLGILDIITKIELENNKNKNLFFKNKVLNSLNNQLDPLCFSRVFQISKGLHKQRCAEFLPLQ